MRSRWSIESVNSCVTVFTEFEWKRDSLSSIGPKAMGNGLGPESDQFPTIWVTLSTISRWLQWLEICFANCLEVSAWRSRPHCPKKGLSAGLRAYWIFPNAFALRGVGWRGDCPCVSNLSAALECMSPTSWSGVRMEMRPSWGGSISLLASFWQRMFFGIRAKATAVPPEDCSYIRLPWGRLVRDLKSVVARGSLRISSPVIIPIGLPFAILWVTGKKGVRSVLLESPVARAVTRTMVSSYRLHRECHGGRKGRSSSF